MDTSAPALSCAAPVLVKFLETTYGEHADEAASRRVEASGGRETGEVKKVWIAVRDLLRSRKHA